MYTSVETTMKKILFFIALLLSSILILYCIKKPITETNNGNYPVLLVGTNAEYKPFCFIENGEIMGFDIDVIKEIAKRLDKQLVIKDLSFDALLPELQLGNLHIVAAGMTPTKKRGKIVLFTKPHFEGSGFVLYVKRNSSITSIDDLKGKTIAVNEGYTTDIFISQFPDITILRLSAASVAEGLLALQSGRTDAFLVAESVIKPLLNKEIAEQYNAITISDTMESTAFAVSKHHASLLPLIDKEIEAMKKDGTIEKLVKKWNLT